MDIVVKGRNVEVPEHYREHVAEKIDKVARLDRKIISIDVELLHEKNPRQQGHCQRVEITCRSRGPVVRAEAAARDFYSALDEAVNKLYTRLRRAADRRRVHRGPGRTPTSVAEATANLPTDLTKAFEPAPSVEVAGLSESAASAVEAAVAAAEADDQPWHIVREKEHSAVPMTIDDALFQMELLGHDFYLFLDKESGRASVVYRRHAYDYGVMSLAEPTE
ncbi:ribosome-associated translation inhibitor RaiA [Natronosporangium hydrolyticum]|uniref:Ribosome hibernation promoting factor n=1 Tax=Natronosporangium hydrolyticum TaxID=2811111 RepID=A0A895YEP3_9ACTN|nr:ribosome-associated translation inhibitor RaiA [Natronosporangium hydrolyticum]QSB13893.1 ribosome-associated translation inhibitor RaiA [Natronosporangium hydrolyticum]